MPKLIEYVEIGFCSSYGDGDYRVSMKVQDLSRERMNELMLTFFHAQRTAWDLWSQEQADEQSEGAKDASPQMQGRAGT